MTAITLRAKNIHTLQIIFIGPYRHDFVFSLISVNVFTLFSD